MSDVSGFETETDVLVDKEMVFEVFGNSLVESEKFYYPEGNVEPEEVLERFTSLKKLSKAVTILVDGAFDVPQPNHDWYLRHCRLLGSKLFLESIDMSVNSENLKKVLGGNAVALAVTVDADFKINAKKGQNGGIRVERPIYPWHLRAERVAGMTFSDGTSLRNTVDLVTVEGDPRHKDTPLETTLDLATFLTVNDLLDGLVIYGEHRQTIVDSFKIGVKTLVIPEKTNYQVDPMTGQPWSSSDMIKRAQPK